MGWKESVSFQFQKNRLYRLCGNENRTEIIGWGMLDEQLEGTRPFTLTHTLAGKG